MSAVLRGVVSPRTSGEPKAFTLAEFTRGALLAFLVFQPMGIVIAFVSGAIVPMGLPAGSVSNVAQASLNFGLIAVIFGAIIGLPCSIAALVVGAPGAYVLGRLVRRVRADGIHLLLFGLFGLVLGAITMSASDAVLAMIVGSGPQAPGLNDVPRDVPFSCASGAAVAIGRLLALRRARKSDALLAGIRSVVERLE